MYVFIVEIKVSCNELRLLFWYIILSSPLFNRYASYVRLLYYSLPSIYFL